MTGNKNPVHGCKLCSPSTGNFQYTKMEKPALKTVHTEPHLNIYTVSLIQNLRKTAELAINTVEQVCSTLIRKRTKLTIKIFIFI